MKNIIRDERTIAAKRKIQSDALQLLIYALWAAILVQQIFLNAPVSQFIVEFICALGVSVYVLIRTICLGIDQSGTGVTTTKSLVTTTLLSGILCVLCLFFLCGIESIGFLALFFICYIAALFSLRYAIKHFTKKKRRNGQVLILV